MLRGVGLGLVAAAMGLTLASAAELDTAIGVRLFKRSWVQAPSSTAANDGLGPLYGARSCEACHPGAERPRVRGSDPSPAGLVLHLGTASGAPDPVYGRQLQTGTVGGVVAEGELVVAGRPERHGRRILHEPVPSLAQAGYGNLSPDTRLSLRIAPGLGGLGRLAAVPDGTILALEDPGDRDGDGISGRASRLPDGRVGRFGWKASQPDLHWQTAAAFSLDLGLSTSRFPAPWGDCSEAETQCRAAPHGTRAGEPEISDELLGLVVSYVAALPAPAPKGSDSGARLFAATGCAACHRPSLPSPDGEVRAFTDLLLHDMGPGLDGGAAEGGAAGRDWRTAPLWGLGSRETAGLLHDARARDIEEAILWHGGEGAAARSLFESLRSGQRAALLDYLRSL